MSHFNPETEELSSNGSYAKYFFHRDRNRWYCLVHLHLGENNDVTYHTSDTKKKQAWYLARKHVYLRYHYLKKKKKRVIVAGEKYNPCISLLSLDQPLLTSREDDISDDVNGDTLPYPRITKEQLDREMDEYWIKKKLPKIEEKDDTLYDPGAKIPVYYTWKGHERAYFNSPRGKVTRGMFSCANFPEN